jgi:hypothetical protein
VPKPSGANRRRRPSAISGGQHDQGVEHLLVEADRGKKPPAFTPGLDVSCLYPVVI